MTFLLTMSLIFSCAFSLPLLTQPISLGLLLLFMSLFISILIFFGSSTWFSFILFLIYIGGLLVMFAYVTALMPNLMFKKNLIQVFFPVSTVFWLLMLYLSDFIGTLLEEQTKMMFLWNSFFNHLGISLFSPFNLLIIVSLALILFFVLICVVKICYFSNGPLRPYKYA
uniref:NADH dehydrogenase subunit 6 n=1 Tax=Katharina tunicata TaxID=34587 RepID=Q34847_KATTU|nr:NADH dehydrogenase subunit 6 [Katharina tunicata]AAC48369.1 NADH dehydrogenase subunit 6 [Katharina tunicata]